MKPVLATLTAALLAACSSTLGDPNVAEKNASPTAQWSLVWSDEFNDTAIDTTKWNYDVDCWGGGNNEKQCYTDSSKNARIDDGVLKLIAHTEQSTGPALPIYMRQTDEELARLATQPYTSARLTTKGKGDWRYGRIEVRAKLPAGQGVWPAIWMLPTENIYGTWAASGEIDIMEAVNLGVPCKECTGGIENEILGTLHYGDNWPDNTHKSETTSLDTATSQFHTYTAQWSEGFISWAIDGVPYGAQTSQSWFTTPRPKNKPHAPFDESFHLILNLAIGGKWPEEDNGGGIDPANFPKSMDVDWVRVYQCTADLETAKACTAQ